MVRLSMLVKIVFLFNWNKIKNTSSYNNWSQLCIILYVHSCVRGYKTSCSFLLLPSLYSFSKNVRTHWLEFFCRLKLKLLRTPPPFSCENFLFRCDITGDFLFPLSHVSLSHIILYPLTGSNKSFIVIVVWELLIVSRVIFIVSKCLWLLRLIVLSKN